MALLRTLVASGTPVFLAVPGPAGHYPARAAINAPLAKFAGDPAAIGEILRRMIRSAAAHRFEPMPPPSEG